MSKTIFFVFLIAISCTMEFDPYKRPGNFLELSKQNVITEFDRILAMDESELDAWEKSKNFVSYRTALKNANNELDLVDTQADLETFQNKYNHVLTLVDSVWTPTIDIPLYQIIADEYGFYKDGNSLNRVVGDYIVTSTIDKYALLKSVKHEFLSERNLDNGLKVVKFKVSTSSVVGREMAACGTFVKASYFHNERNCRNDREVVVEATSYMVQTSDYQGDWRQFRVKAEVIGYQRVGTWCNWRQYVTTLYRRNTSYTIDGWTIVNGVPTRKPYNIVLTDHTLESSQIHDDRWIGARILNANVGPNPFTELHMEGSSRGVAGVWAVADCR